MEAIMSTILGNPIILSFVMCFIWVLLPMVPSIIIYRIFPESKVGASGVLANLKINATGAFAAYLIILVAAAIYWLGNVQALIPNASYQTWEVTAFVRYADEDGRPLPNQDRYLERTNVDVMPFLETKTPKEVKLVVTGQARNITATFSSQDTGFSTATLDLQKDSLLIDGYKVTAFDTLEIRQVPAEKVYSSVSAQPLAATQTGPPPAGRSQ